MCLKLEEQVSESISGKKKNEKIFGLCVELSSTRALLPLIRAAWMDRGILRLRPRLFSLELRAVAVCVAREGRSVRVGSGQIGEGLAINTAAVAAKIPSLRRSETSGRNPPPSDQRNGRTREACCWPEDRNGNLFSWYPPLSLQRREVYRRSLCGELRVGWADRASPAAR